MKQIAVAVFGTLVCTVLSLSLKVKEETKMVFIGEDVHMAALSSVDGVEVLFKPSSRPVSEEVLMRGGLSVNSRARLNAEGHLILENVSEEDDGLYVVKNSLKPADVRHITLFVKDCSLENVVKYGETYTFPLDSVEGPISLEFRSSHSPANQTEEAPAVLLLNQTAGPAPGYRGRLSVTEKKVTLHRVRTMDEGSYTVLDRDGKVRKRTCLNVKEHQTFVRLPTGHTLKINLYMDHTQVTVQYTPDSDNRERVIVEQGVVAPLEPALDGRLIVEGSMVILERVRFGDMGLFVVTDLDGFQVANIFLLVEAYKLPTLWVVILSMLGLLAFLLLVCLVSCLVKIRRRAEKSRKITLIAQQAGKGDGDAFRQVVQEAYTRFAEESSRSTCENITESTEVTIKGLEVSKAGRYHNLSPDRNYLESDSGVEFTTSALPLDSDTDVPMTYVSHKLLLDADGHATDTLAEELEDASPQAPPPASPRAPPLASPQAPPLASPQAPPPASPQAVDLVNGPSAVESEDQGVPESAP